jgi:MFS transporter, DHA1 family, multidrug resistance protein
MGNLGPQPVGPPNGMHRMVGWSQHPGILLAMMGQTFLNMLGVGIVGPVLPLYASSFGVSAAMVGLLISAFGIARIPVNVPAGSLAERLGRKPLLVGGPLLIAASALLTGMAGSFGQMVVFRLLQGVGSALQMTGAMIVMADISTPRDRGRTMSFYQGSLLLGTSVGPIIGGFIGEHLGFRTPFFAYAALALCGALWALLRVPETRPAAPQRRQEARASIRGAALRSVRWGDVGRLLLNRNFMLVSLVTLVIFFTRTGSQNTVLPLLGNDRLDLGPAKLGYAFTLVAVVNLFTINASGIVCDRYGRKRAIVPSCLLCGAALVTYTLGTSYTHFMLSSVLLGLGTGVGGPAPAAYVSDLDLPGGRGLTMGVYRTVSDVGVTVGPVLLGWISDRFSYDAALWVNGLLFVVVGVAFGVLARETRARVEEQVVSPEAA